MPQLITDFLASRVTEVSFAMATIMMLFAGDYLTDRFLIKRIRKRNVIIRTTIFLCYVLLALPLVTVFSARALAALVLAPLGGYVWVLLAGFFLPGDTLLFTAGFLASRGIFSFWLLIGLTFLAAVLGDSFGYAFGRKVGPAIFKKEDSIIFHKDHLERAENFYKKHGKKV